MYISDDQRRAMDLALMRAHNEGTIPQAYTFYPIAVVEYQTRKFILCEIHLLDGNGVVTKLKLYDNINKWFIGLKDSSLDETIGKL
jgi:hypothetical protein